MIDSNEDGFSRANVEAISKVGVSTKNQASGHGYIGEKGIGFKSIFKVADTVTIKSEPYSFSFHYPRLERHGGLGMIIPRLETYTEMPDRGTRMFLTDFHGTDFQTLKSELEHIPETLLLFLRRLKSIVIRVESAEEIHETTWSLQRLNTDGFEEIHVSTSLLSNAGEPTRREVNISILKFYVERTLASNLPNDVARRTVSGEYITSASMVLAFPIDMDNQPRIEEQYTYAFLPMRKFGFTVS